MKKRKRQRAEEQVKLAEVFGGPHDGDFFATAGCTVGVVYDFYPYEDRRPVNMPHYRLLVRGGVLVWKFVGY